jgi:hypothetical protein
MATAAGARPNPRAGSRAAVAERRPRACLAAPAGVSRTDRRPPARTEPRLRAARAADRADDAAFDAALADTARCAIADPHRMGVSVVDDVQAPSWWVSRGVAQPRGGHHTVHRCSRRRPRAVAQARAPGANASRVPGRSRRGALRRGMVRVRRYRPGFGLPARPTRALLGCAGRLRARLTFDAAARRSTCRGGRPPRSARPVAPPARRSTCRGRKPPRPARPVAAAARRSTCRGGSPLVQLVQIAAAARGSTCRGRKPRRPAPAAARAQAEPFRRPAPRTATPSGGRLRRAGGLGSLRSRADDQAAGSSS